MKNALIQGTVAALITLIMGYFFSIDYLVPMIVGIFVGNFFIGLMSNKTKEKSQNTNSPKKK